MYQKTELKNGLRIVTHRMKDRYSASIGFWIGAGGRYEEDRIKGAAHFIEHVVFKGSAKYSCDEIKQQVEGVGGTLNAFTSEEQTCYYAKIPAQHLAQAFDVLSDIVFFPKINPQEVKKEADVIVEEIKMYRDLPQYMVVELLEETMWPNHPLGKSLAGSVATVSNMTKGDLKTFFERNYNPANIVIAACGDFDHQTIVHLAENKMGKIQKGEVSQYAPASRAKHEPHVKLFHKKIEQMHLALGMYGYHEQHPERYPLSLLSVILGGNMSSRLFVEVREKRGLAYSIGCQPKFLHDAGQLMIRAGVDNTKIVETLKVILKELEKIRKKDISPREFKQGKDYLLGQLQLGLEDTMEHMLWIGEDLVSVNRTKTLESVIAEFERLTPADVKRVAKDLLDPNGFHLAVVGPVSAEQDTQIRELLGAAKV